MSESTDARESELVETPQEMDRITRWLVWAVVGAMLMLLSVGAYAYLAGAFDKNTPPRTAEENVLATTAASIANDPSDGLQYAIRAEALHSTGDSVGAFQVLDQGEAAVRGKNPALLYILRSRTALLNREKKYAEAAKVGVRAMMASDDYLKAQGIALAQKGIQVVGGNTQTRVSVDTALQVAEACMALKRYDEAINLYDYALRLEPTAADIISMRGWAQLTRGDKVKAKADFAEALQYLPDDPYALKGMKELSN